MHTAVAVAVNDDLADCLVKALVPAPIALAEHGEETIRVVLTLEVHDLYRDSIEVDLSRRPCTPMSADDVAVERDDDRVYEPVVLEAQCQFAQGLGILIFRSIPLRVLRCGPQVAQESRFLAEA